MKCPKCDGKVGVVETYPYDGAVYRRRKCKSCGYVFHTMEDIVKYDYEIAGVWACKRIKSRNKE